MNEIDIEQFHLFIQQMKKIKDENEENWYLIKRVLNEMAMDDLYENVRVDQELTQALTKLEHLMESFETLFSLDKWLIEEYESALSKDSQTLERMKDYAKALKSNISSLCDEVKTIPSDLVHTNTAAIQDVLKQQYGEWEVENE